MAYKKLFEPGRIGGLTIRNRAVMSPMGTDLADIRGNATPRLIAYYTERAKGGIGLIINEYTGVDDVDSIPTQHNLRMAQDYNVQEAEELTRSVHAYGAKIFAQLHHGGATSKSAFTGRQNLSPSGVPMAPGGEVPREMTLEDIKRVQEVIARESEQLVYTHFNLIAAAPTRTAAPWRTAAASSTRSSPASGPSWGGIPSRSASAATR